MAAGAEAFAVAGGAQVGRPGGGRAVVAIPAGAVHEMAGGHRTLDLEVDVAAGAGAIGELVLVLVAGEAGGHGRPQPPAPFGDGGVAARAVTGQRLLVAGVGEAQVAPRLQDVGGGEGLAVAAETGVAIGAAERSEVARPLTIVGLGVAG